MLWVVVCLGVLLLTVSRLRGTVASEEPSDDVTAQLKQLQDKVLLLEKRIAALEKQPSFVTLGTPADIYPKFNTIPKGWREREFNGMKYYIIPLCSQAGQASEGSFPLPKE